MKNFANMMKQAQDMQAKVQELQEQVAQMEVSGSSGGGMVTVVMTVKGSLKSLKVDPSLVDPNEVGVMEDLIVAAVNDAKGKAEATMQEQTQKLLGGMGLPEGFKLPF